MNSEIDKVINQILQWRKLIIVTSKKITLAQVLIDEQYAIVALKNLKKEIKTKKRRRNRK